MLPGAEFMTYSLYFIIYQIIGKLIHIWALSERDIFLKPILLVLFNIL